MKVLINQKEKSFWNKIHLDPVMLFVLFLLLIYSIIVVWSASGQNIDMIRCKISQTIIGLAIMIIIAQIPPRVYENCSLYFYIFCMILLIVVNTFGSYAKGAQRWLDIGIIRFQPSEIAKIVVPLVTARFINRSNYPPSIRNISIVILLITIPTLLVALQPDLGTSIIIAFSGLFILFLSGLSWRIINIFILTFIIFVPILWFFLMQDYQRQRVIILINPEIDPLGTGYHILQSKIAIGSGGFYGKGWLHGTQSQLEFLPERHTDFIFSVLAEEFGLLGVLLLLILYIILIVRGLWVASRARNTFNRLVSSGLMLILFFCIFTNISMVSGILPIVGVPLPLVSYGGSALTVLMAEFGIIMSIHTHQKVLSRTV